jgi:glutathione S-transferase
MLTLFYAPGACSTAAHIVLEESGEKYEPKRVDLVNGEQRTEAYLKINPQGRVPQGNRVKKPRDKGVKC